MHPLIHPLIHSVYLDLQNVVLCLCINIIFIHYCYIYILLLIFCFFVAGVSPGGECDGFRFFSFFCCLFLFLLCLFVRFLFVRLFLKAFVSLLPAFDELRFLLFANFFLCIHYLYIIYILFLYYFYIIFISFID